MENIKLDTTKAAEFLAADAVKNYEPQVKVAQEALENGTCQGNDFLGWLHLPTETTDDFLNDIEVCAELLRSKCDTVVVAGIGGLVFSFAIGNFAVSITSVSVAMILGIVLNAILREKKTDPEAEAK